MHRPRSETAEGASQSLPALAPRASQTTPSRSSSTRTNSAARPRSSHRSRAGCWTCRGRKVKCDEAHPRCGPCTRLNKVCDWDQRWNFSDATQSTQNKFANVNTVGNAVWDPNAPRSGTSVESTSPRRDSLPSFADLTNDEDRERKAEGHRPGTYTVIVNPDSFSSMPEYASPIDGRRMSVQSLQSSMGSSTSEQGRAIVLDDPNTVVLTRFEDAAPSLPSFFMSTIDRRPSLPGDMGRLEISTPSQPVAPALHNSQALQDQQLIRHYEQKISPRLLALSRNHHEPTIEDPIIVESRRFPPLHHAICALSLLSLHHRGLAKRQDALERIDQTTGLLSQSVRSKDIDLQSDALFYLHFILLVYDASNPLDDDNLWYRHVQHLRQTVLTRQRQSASPEALNWVVGFALWLDTQAALAGRDSGMGLLRAHMNNDLFPLTPTFEHNVSPYGTASSEDDVRSMFLFFGKNALTMMGKLAVLSMRMRGEHNSPHTPQAAQHILLGRQRAVRQYQAELYDFWTRAHPPMIPRDTPTASAQLPQFVRHLYYSGFLMLCICAIYSHTCMFPGQLLRNPNARAEVARNCNNVLDMTTSIVSEGMTDPPDMGLATFLAGFAAPDYDSKVRAINLLQVLEERGISNNAKRARDLLVAVCEEQRQRVLAGGRAEDIDWQLFAKARRMETLDFGL